MAKGGPGVDFILAKYCDLNIQYLISYHILYDCRFHSEDRRPSHILLFGNYKFFSRIQLITYIV